MLRHVLSLGVILGLGSIANAAALVSLVPAAPGNGVAYVPGEHVRVDFNMQLDASSPATIRTRLLQFDLSDSSPALTYMPVENHPLADIGPIPFWNLSGSAICASDEASCGTNYFIDGNVASDDILNMTYTGLTSSGNFQVILRQASPTIVGSLMVMMPMDGGTFVLDVLNADETNENFGAELRYGFGTTADPGSTILRAQTGGMILVPGPGTDEFGRVSFAVIPEPATLALLGLGGVVAAFRRRLP